MAKVLTLERPVYGVGEAAELLGLRSDKVHGWLDGYTRKRVFYEPVIREQSTGSKIVTWGEFVELGYLREYRRAGVPLQRLRPVIQTLRKRFETPYPLAHYRPYIDGLELVMKVQEEQGIPSTIAMVVRTGQQLMLSESVERFLRKVSFAPTDASTDEVAVRMRPAGKASPVVIDPLLRFGRPTVAGVATERLWELNDAGESLEDIAGAYDLDLHLVEAAVAYEEQQRSVAA
ncbi:MAG TPA: DUF433 domain-containing protein [Acidimicrobiales bacterium]|nr:DUF433 domain-containing protein [Acidimicrobiales bacterium]